MGLLGRKVLGQRCEVKTARTHYKGHVVGYMYRTKNYQVKITEVIAGTKKVGNIITAKDEQMFHPSI